MIYRILSRKRLLVVILSYIVISSYCYLNVLNNSMNITFFESTMLSSTQNKTIAGMFMMIVFPVISTFLLSDIFFEDESLNLKYLWYVKNGVVRYHIKNVLYILIIVFFITFVCFGFNILLSYISFGNLQVSSTSVFFDFRLENNANDITHYNLLLQSPEKFFILKNLYISLFGSLFAMFSYLISVFIKNKYIIIILPAIIYNSLGLLVSVVGRPGYSLYNLLYPDFSVLIRNPELLNMYALGLILINIILFIVMVIKEKEYV